MKYSGIAFWWLLLLDIGFAGYLVDQGIFAFRALSHELGAGEAVPPAAVWILLVHLVPASVMALSAFLLFRRLRFRWFVQGLAFFLMFLVILGHVLFAVSGGAAQKSVRSNRVAQDLKGE